MLREEAAWLSQFIYSKPPAEVFPMLDLGSCTEQYRKVTQPWIDEMIFAPRPAAGPQGGALGHPQ